jgi:hypothetical protein
MVEPALTAQEIAVVQQLIELGALVPDPATSQAQRRPTAARTVAGLMIWGYAAYGVWSFWKILS